MTTAACCAAVRAPAVPALPVLLPRPRLVPGVAPDVLPLERRTIRLHRPAAARAWLAVVEAWKAWRAAARRQAELRALARLDRHLLRDLGLAEEVPPRAAPAWQDLERARW